jgi:two-component system, sensor histidine kinase and response regulator
MKMIVHDLKSPLTAILGTLEMAIEGDLGPLTPQLQRLLTDGMQRGADSLQLMDDLLELTQLEESHLTLDLQEVDPAELVQGVAADWRVRAEQRGATIRVRAAPVPPVQADSYLLRRVFSNLIGNALRHAGSDVQLELATEVEGDTDGVRFSVRDNGVGIPPAYHDVIFRKFETIQRRGGRPTSGLGLTFCKLAVEAHGGRIWVDSATTQGATFHFVIPSRRRAGAAPAEAIAGVSE